MVEVNPHLFVHIIVFAVEVCAERKPEFGNEVVEVAAEFDFRTRAKFYVNSSFVESLLTSMLSKISIFFCSDV